MSQGPSRPADGVRPRTAGHRVARLLRVGLLGLAIAATGLGPTAGLAAQEGGSGVVTTDAVLRTGPDEEAAPLAVVPAGARVGIDGRAENGYYPVRHGGLDGWLATGYLAAAVDAAPAAVDDAVSIAAAQDAGRETPRDAAAAGRDDGADSARRGAAGRRDRDRLPRDRNTVVLTTDALNLRADPSRSADVLRTLAAGEEVDPTGERDGEFVEVEHDDALGWVAAAHLATRQAATPADPNPSPARRRRVQSDGDDRSERGDAVAPADLGAQDPPRNPSEAELIRLISDAADYYGQPRQDMLRVARCESELTPTAVNPRTGDSGLFQFNPNTWLSTPYAEEDIFDPRASAYAAGWMWSVGRRNEWVCQ